MTRWLAGILLAVSGSGVPEAMDFLPVSLSCPADNAGVLEVVTRNRAGMRERFQAAVTNEHVTYAAQGRAEAGAEIVDFLVVTTSVMTTFRDDGSVEVELAGKNSERVAAEILGKANALGGETCEGSEEAQRRHAEILAENRRSLGLE